MPTNIDHDRRELVARVATLELLVADLIELLWRVDPAAMDELSRTAAQDLDIQHSHFMPAGAENQRERLFAVLRNRQAKLDRGRARAKSELKSAAR
jgi:hypothetical protein